LTKFLVVFDVDSTLIEDEAIELLADYAGTRAEVSEITERAMRGELDFAESLSARVATLSGLGEEVLDAVAAALRPTAGAQELITEVHRRGGLAAAVSGGFNQLLGPLREQLQLDFVEANTLEVAGGKLTGKTVGRVVTAEVKREMLERWREQLGLEAGQVIAVGDGANDLLMLGAAGLGVAFDAKPIVRAAAQLALDERDLAKLIGLLP
jgi:phosphoserine phosphatase